MKQFIYCPECGMPILAELGKGIISQFEYSFKCEYCQCEGFDYEVKPAKAISIRQPWSYLICSGIKDIENRTWKTNFRGRVLIHAGAKQPNAISELLSEEQILLFEGCKYYTKRVFSAIIGSVEIVDCVINHESIWAERTKGKVDLNLGTITLKEGQKPIYNWVLKNPILFEKPVPCKGKLSFFIPEIL